MSALAIPSLATSAPAAIFPPIVELRDLRPDAGGDGTDGFVIFGVDANDRSASAVSGAGDVNSDGIDDILIGAYLAESGPRSEAGESYIVFGRADGFPAGVALSDLFPQSGGDGSRGVVLKGFMKRDESGAALGMAGDLNGDGIDDVIIGAPSADPNDFSSAGESYLVFGRANAFPPVFRLRDLRPQGGGDGSAGVVIKGIDTQDYSGRAVAAAGDVNGDGFDDVVVSAEDADPNDRPDAGETYVVFGRGIGFPANFELRSLLPEFGGDGTEGFVLDGINGLDNSGRAVAAAGDVNGDGLDDLLIGASNATHSGDDDGEAYVVFGRANGFPAAFDLRMLLPQSGGDGSEGFVMAGVARENHAGNSVGSAGDMNGDGIDDLIVGAPTVRDQTGESYVVFGRATFPPIVELRLLLPQMGGDGSEGFVLLGAKEGGYLGESLASVGDVNGDGLDDVLVGAKFAGSNAAGQSYVIFGRTTPFPGLFPVSRLFPGAGGDGSEGFVLNGIHEAAAGSAVSGAGDVNGDGVADVVIGAPGTNDAHSPGESYVFFGRASEHATRRN